jgi:hypothetical protein
MFGQPPGGGCLSDEESVEIGYDGDEFVARESEGFGTGRHGDFGELWDFEMHSILKWETSGIFIYSLAAPLGCNITELGRLPGLHRRIPT